MGLMRQAIRGSMIVATGNYLVYAATILAQLWLIRLLAPADYGFYAIVIVIVELTYVLLMVEFATACVYRMEDDNVFHTAVLMAIVWCGGVTLLLWLIGPLAKHWIDDKTWSFVTILVFAKTAYGVGAVYGGYIERDLKLGYLTVVRSLSRIVALMFGIFLAENGYGVQALLAIDILNYALATILTIIVSPLKVRWRHYSIALGKIVLQKGYSQFQFRLSGIVLYRSPVMLVEAITGDKALVGLIDRAMYVAGLANAVTSAFHSKIAFIVFRRLSSIPGALSHNLDILLWIIPRLLSPIPVLFVAYSDSIVTWLFGEQWHLLAPILRGLAAFSIIVVVYNVLNQALMGLDSLKKVTITQWVMCLAVWSSGLIIIGNQHPIFIFAYIWSVLFIAASTYLIYIIKGRIDFYSGIQLVLPPILVSNFLGYCLSPSDFSIDSFLIIIGGITAIVIFDLYKNRKMVDVCKDLIISFFPSVKK